MKRFGNIFEEMCSLENIERAHYNARKGKAHYQEVKKVNAQPDKHYKKIHDMLVNKKFKTGQYKEFVKTDTHLEQNADSRHLCLHPWSWHP